MQKLTRSAKTVYEYVRENKQITTTRIELGRNLNISLRTLARALSLLEELGLITKYRGKCKITLESTELTLNEVLRDLRKTKKGHEGSRRVMKGHEGSRRATSRKAMKGHEGSRRVMKGHSEGPKTPPSSQPTIKDSTTKNSNTLYNNGNTHTTEQCITILNSHNNDCDVAQDLKKSEQNSIDQTEAISVCPSIPAKTGVSVSKIKPNGMPPYPKKGYNISAIWYWAIQRYKQHGLDFRFTQALFRKMASQYARSIGSTLGKEWKEHKEYIDWFLGQNDDFIRQETKFGFNYLASGHCLNKRIEQRGNETFIDNDEDRRTAGEWVK